MEPRPSVLVFDVNETLLDIETLEPLFLRLFGEARAMRTWFADLILHAEAATLAGAYAPFARLGAGVLRMLGEIRGVTISAEDLAELRARLLAMPAHTDVLPSLGRLKEAGFRLATLTNSAPDPEAHPLERTGIAPLLERQFSVHAVGRLKPAPEVYRQVSEAYGLPPSAFCLIAAHGWDTMGAQALGWRGAFVARRGNAPLRVEGLPAPDLEAPDLATLAADIIARWG